MFGQIYTISFFDRKVYSEARETGTLGLMSFLPVLPTKTNKEPVSVARAPALKVQLVRSGICVVMDARSLFFLLFRTRNCEIRMFSVCIPVGHVFVKAKRRIHFFPPKNNFF